MGNTWQAVPWALQWGRPTADGAPEGEQRLFDNTPLLSIPSQLAHAFSFSSRQVVGFLGREKKKKPFSQSRQRGGREGRARGEKKIDLSERHPTDSQRCVSDATPQARPLC